jgi:hypothetical protein
VTLPRIAFTRPPWTDDQTYTFLDVAHRVLERNRNRRGVSIIKCITDDLDTVYEYPVKKGKTDTTNLGTCFYFTYWKPETREYVRSAVIHLDTQRTGVATTFAHEVAHSMTTGTHGYTWRRMFALLLPLAWKHLRPGVDAVSSGRLWADVTYQLCTDVRRYGRRYESGWVNDSSGDEGEEYLHRSEKIEREVESHLAASKRFFKIFGE